jgi:hypothetical protein
MYYIYAYLREDKSPYYIGKGKGKRAWVKCRSVPRPKEKERIIFLIENIAKEEDAFEWEKFFIAAYGRKNNATGILRNLTDGGEGMSGHIQSPEHIKKSADARRGKKRPYISEKLKGRISLRRGIPMSEEDKQKRRKPKLNKENYRKPKSEKHKLNIKNSLIGRKRLESEFRTYNWEITTPNNEIFVIKNLSKFCRENNLSSGALCIVAQGKRNHHKGYKTRRI